MFEKILPAILQEEWVLSCGSLLYAEQDGFGFVKNKIYVEFKNVIFSEENRKTILSNPYVRETQAVEGLFGYMLEIDPAIGLEIIALSHKFFDLQDIKTSEVQLERIQTGSILDFKARH